MNIADILEGDSRSKLWIKAHLDYPHRDWCLIWPFSRDTDGYCQFGEDRHSVHRLMCWHRNGPSPSNKTYAAHSCGRGHDGCVNQWHMNWRTPGENQIERYQHAGIVQPRFRLTPEQVDEILVLRGKFTTSEIGKMFGVSRTNISRIHNGKMWTDTQSRQQRIFTPDEVRLIRSTPWKVRSAVEFAKEFGVSRSTIDRIRGRLTYQYVEDRATSASQDTAQDHKP
jgi:hypothetical protein